MTGVMNGLISLLPTGGSLPQGVDDALAYMVPIWSGWTQILPFLDTLVIIIGLGLAIELAIFTYGGVNWTINKLRGSG